MILKRLIPILTFCAATSSIGISEAPQSVQTVYTSINLCRNRGLKSVWMKQARTVCYKAIFNEGQHYDMASTDVWFLQIFFWIFLKLSFNYFLLQKVSVKAVFFFLCCKERCNFIHFCSKKQSWVLFLKNVMEDCNKLKYTFSIFFSVVSDWSMNILFINKYSGLQQNF